jgi:two-component system response regulator VicR
VPSIVKRILLVEDDAGAQLLYSNRLTDLGFEVVVSPTGAMGLMEARSRPFDLYLVDIGLGSGIDGYEVCRRLRDDPSFDDLRIIMLTSSDDKHAAFEAGVDDYLNKDIDLLNLPNRVKMVLEL